MKKLILTYCILFLSSVVCLEVSAQTTKEQAAKRELKSKGIDEAELRKRLLEKGIDLEQLQNIDVNDIDKVQLQIEEVVKEMEKEQEQIAKQKPVEKTKGGAVLVPNKGGTPVKKTGEDTELAPIVGGVSSDTIIKKQIADSNKIAIYGQQIFRNQSLQLYRQANDIKAPSTYVLGAGDQVTVSIWGLSQLNEVYEINAEGYITPDRMPRIFLKGISLEQAKKVLHARFRNFFQFDKNQFDIALNYSRTINVDIFGEVFQVGGFTIPATNTAFNALVAAGGPTDIGSVRRISLIRNGKKSEIDIYKFMADPRVAKDFYLENNDIIQVPVAEKLVSIKGAINKSYKFELLKEENLKQLLVYAGGFTEFANKKTLLLERYEGDMKKAYDIPFFELERSKGDFVLQHGDVIYVDSISEQIESFVHVKGAVRTEGSFQFVEGMRLSDLVKKIQLTAESRMDLAFLRRYNPNGTIHLQKVNLEDALSSNATESNVLLKVRDELTVYKLSQYTDKSLISISGAVRDPQIFKLNADALMRVYDVLMLAGGLRPEAWDYAYIYRKESQNSNISNYIRVNLNAIMKNQADTDNVILQSHDSIVVFFNDFFTEEQYVEISGAVNKPGRYPFGANMTIQDILTLSGGMSFSAASNRVDIFRVIIKNNEPTQTVVATLQLDKNLVNANLDKTYILMPYDQVVVRYQPEFELQKVVNISGEVKYPGRYALINPNERLHSIIQRAGGLKAESFPEGATLFRMTDSIGYVIMRLDEALKNHESRYNYLLKDGDEVDIPKKKDLVTILGATNARELYPDKMLSSNNALTVAYFEGKNAKYYIDEFAAGVAKSGNKRLITVEHPNGKIARTKRILFFNSYPKVEKGSKISVGSMPEKEKIQKTEQKEKVEWNKVVADIIGQATAVISLILLVDRLE